MSERWRILVGDWRMQLAEALATIGAATPEDAMQSDQPVQLGLPGTTGEQSR